MSDIDECDNLKEVDRGNIVAIVDCICLRPMKKGDDKYLVGFNICSSGPDPKVHFRNLEDASKFYDFIISLFAGSTDTLHTVDVLEHNAI